MRVFWSHCRALIIKLCVTPLNSYLALICLDNFHTKTCFTVNIGGRCRSVLSPIIFFNLNSDWLSVFLNRTIDSHMKVLNHVLLTLESYHDVQKQNILPFLSLRINRLNQLIVFSFRTRTFISILAWYFRRCCIRQASFTISWFNRFILSSLNVKVLFIIIKVRNMKNVSMWPKKKDCWFPLTLPGQFYPAWSINFIGIFLKIFLKPAISLFSTRIIFF
jgi:hypothetical protein